MIFIKEFWSKHKTKFYLAIFVLSNLLAGIVTYVILSYITPTYIRSPDLQIQAVADYDLNSEVYNNLYTRECYINSLESRDKVLLLASISIKAGTYDITINDLFPSNSTEHDIDIGMNSYIVEGDYMQCEGTTRTYTLPAGMLYIYMYTLDSVYNKDLSNDFNYVADQIVVVPSGSGTTDPDPDPNPGDSWQEGYDQGYQEGYDKGKQDGLEDNTSYDEGYKKGQADGYDKGFTDGTESDIGSVFSKGIGAIANFLYKLLSIEVWGISLFQIIGTLGAVLVVVTLIKVFVR